MACAPSWKLIFENYSECYHVWGVHPALAKVATIGGDRFCEGPFLGGFMKIAKGE